MRSSYRSNLKRDQYGNTIDPGQSKRDRAIELGVIWKINLPKVTINSGASDGISFVTPPASVGACYLVGVSMSKVSGGITAQFKEGDTLTGGVAGTPLNLNRARSATPDAGCPLTGVTINFSASTGGIVLLETTLAGTAAANRQPLTGSPDTWVRLAPSTRYTHIMTADTANTPTTSGLDVAIFPEIK